MDEKLVECVHCGTKNSSSSLSCYACGKSLEPTEPDSVDVDDQKQPEDDKECESQEVELSVCDLCRLLGQDHDTFGSHCTGCKNNPHRWRDTGCGCLFVIVLVILLAILEAKF